MGVWFGLVIDLRQGGVLGGFRGFFGFFWEVFGVFLIWGFCEDFSGGCMPRVKIVVVYTM